MDPLSALGALAASSQLVEQGCKLIKLIKDIISKANEDPETSRKPVVHIEQLVKLAKLVRSNPSLQTAELELVLQSCLKHALELLAVLEKQCIRDTSGKLERLKIAFKKVVKEDQVATQFEILEQQKSLLALYIHNVDS
jgi:hypothetical protein